MKFWRSKNAWSEKRPYCQEKSLVAFWRCDVSPRASIIFGSFNVLAVSLFANNILKTSRKVAVVIVEFKFARNG